MGRGWLAQLSTCSKLGFRGKLTPLCPWCSLQRTLTQPQSFQPRPTPIAAYVLSWSSVAQARSRTRKIHEPQLSTFTKPDFPLEDPPISHSFLTKCLVYATEIEFRRHAATAGQGVAHVLSWSSVFYRPLKRILNRESQVQQDMKSTEWYALRRHNPRIRTWHTVAPHCCTSSKLEFALGC